jgi:hypothetical protein
MKHVSPERGVPVDPSWWAPLEGVARTVRGVRRYQFFDLGDFMLMGCEIRSPRPRVVLYKHYYTRRYLNLDDGGHAYRYAVPRSKPDGPGRYLKHRSLADAVDHLGLWELPWMKRGLEQFRFGYSVDERYLARDLLDPIDDLDLGPEPNHTTEVFGRGRLRLV